MVQDIFIDGAAELQVQGQLVRVNLVVNSATDKDNFGARIREVRYQLIMPAQAATELHRGLTGALEHLTKAGVVARQEPAPQREEMAVAEES